MWRLNSIKKGSYLWFSIWFLKQYTGQINNKRWDTRETDKSFFPALHLTWSSRGFLENTLSLVTVFFLDMLRWHRYVPSVIHLSSFPVDHGQEGTANLKDQAGPDQSRGDQRQMKQMKRGRKTWLLHHHGCSHPGEFSLVSDMIRCEWRWVSGEADPTLSQTHLIRLVAALLMLLLL